MCSCERIARKPQGSLAGPDGVAELTLQAADGRSVEKGKPSATAGRKASGLTELAGPPTENTVRGKAIAPTRVEPSWRRARNDDALARPARLLLRSVSISVLAQALLASASAYAQVWDGSENADWTDGANWSTNAPPTTGDVVISTTSPNPAVLGVSGAAVGTSRTMHVGSGGGTGNLTIQNGSTLTSNAAGYSYVGLNGGSVGVVNVTGAGSRWIINGTPSAVSLLLGSVAAGGGRAEGTLNISDGGAVQTAGDIVVGETNGAGFLNVTSGGTLTTGRDGYIGRHGGSEGTAVISGTGSSWTITRHLYIGNGGPGALTISDNALVDVGVDTALGRPSNHGALNITSGGVLRTRTLNRHAAGTAQVNFDGGTLRAKANTTGFVSGFTGTELNIASGGLTVDTDGFNVTASSPFSGTGTFTKVGAGTLTLAGANSTAFSGVMAINEGTLSVASEANLGTGGLSFDGGTLQNTGAFTTALPVTLNTGGGTFQTGADLTLSGVIDGDGALTKTGNSTLTLTGANTYAGETWIQAGTLALSGAGSIAGSSRVVADGTFDISAVTPTTANIQSLAGSGTVNLGAKTLALTDAEDTFAGSITGTGNVRVFAGTQTLTGTSNHTGSTRVSGTGHLRLLNGGQITDTSNLTLDGTNSTATVSGTGSRVEAGGLGVGTTIGSNSTLNVLNGGVVDTAGGTAIIGGPGAQSGTINVDGAGSLLNVGLLSIGTFGGNISAFLNVTNGAEVWSDVGSVGSGNPGTGAAEVLISGAGSSWTVDGELTLRSNVSMSVLDGGAASAMSSTIGSGNGATSDFLVSGAGSTYFVSNDQVIGSGSGTGIVTLADGALMTVGGQLTLASGASSTGILNIGGAEGQAATGAGVLDAATLTFGPGTGRLNFNHTDTAYDFATAISGAGAVNHASGVTNLTGDSSLFTGAATVSGGTLRVNGTLGGAVSTVSVLADATLGGAGTIGGDVTIADGGILAPGNSPGTLTIEGDLTLSDDSILNFEFGQANVPGGEFNDLVNVGGNLTLDGVLNVSVPDNGSFRPGVYRMFNYGGALTNNTLEFGALPTDSDVFVQTAVANQVNLVNTAGLTLNFWDGPAGGKNDADIAGGDGVWRLDDGENNWADVDGLANADYSQDSFAVFNGTAGTVMVDNGGGAIRISGMQFAVDGYVIEGDALTLAGTNADIFVGDGSAASGSYVAIIDAELAGAAQLVKTGAGRLMLTGANTYTGGTAIYGGVVEIANDSNLGESAGGLSFDGGALHTTADIASARDFAFAGDGGLIIDPATTLILNGALSGAGDLRVEGGGMLVLNGASARSGATTLAAGSLYVNSDQSAASGLTMVLSGALLGGTGVIGGDVAVAGGGVLAPGFNAPGTLTIAGNLSLASASVLEFEFGAADVVGGGLNDLIHVAGDLVLDGVINVSVPATGAFGPGIYRVINYGGSLTNNGLNLGVMPASGVFVQTSLAGQVNLVNTTGVTLNFWDGAASARNDGAIGGGGGVWQSGAGNDNWTDVSGALNAPYQNGAYSVFAGTGGSITVDASLGAIMSTGMQFAADGYVIGGDAIELLPPSATIQVGDGSGAVYTATINAVLSGAADLIKTGDGVLVLGGVNTYDGDTRIEGGALRISADANLGGADGAVIFDGGALNTTASFASARDIVFAGDGAVDSAADTVLTLSGALSGDGLFTKSGEGDLVLAGDASAFLGDVHVNAGMLAIETTLASLVNVGADGRLEGTGEVGAVSNAGTIAPGRDGMFGALTIAGDYAGGGVLEIETALGEDASSTDRLVVLGDTSGATQLVVLNRGGLGGQTIEGIKIVDVEGASNGVFTLIGDYTFYGDPAVIGGAYAYRLYQGGVSTPGDGDWYLRSRLLSAGPDAAPGPLYQPGAPVYETYLDTLLALNHAPTLRQRIGARQWAPGASSDEGVGVWGRIEGAMRRTEANRSTTQAANDVDSVLIQAGADGLAHEGQRGGRIVLGVTGHYQRAQSEVDSVFGGGGVEVEGVGLGATATWYGASGAYVDLQAQHTWYRANLDSDVLGGLADGNDGVGRLVSLEIGQPFAHGERITLTPQAQLTYANVDADTFADPANAVVSAGDGDSLQTRLGFSVDYQSGGARYYGVASASYEWLDGTSANVSGTTLAHSNDRLRGELGFGFEYNTAAVSLYSEVTANTSLEGGNDGYSARASAGMRVRL
jgi:fibronectin-binding autotransporter adhesin